MKLEDKTRERLSCENSDVQRLRAALLAEFATLIKQCITANPVICEKRGAPVVGIAVPVISWTVFEGDAESALRFVQANGLPSNATAERMGLQDCIVPSMPLANAMN